MVEYISLRRWLGNVEIIAGATPFADAKLQEEGARLGSETKADLCTQKAQLLDANHRAWVGRHKRHAQAALQKQSQKYSDDVKISAQILQEGQRRCDAAGDSYRETMLEDIMLEKDLETRSRILETSLSRQNRSTQADDKLSRSIADKDHDLERRKLECMLMETAGKKSDRMRLQAKAFDEIKQQCRPHSRTGPAPHTARLSRNQVFEAYLQPLAIPKKGPAQPSRSSKPATLKKLSPRLRKELVKKSVSRSFIVHLES